MIAAWIVPGTQGTTRYQVPVGETMKHETTMQYGNL